MKITDTLKILAREEIANSDYSRIAPLTGLNFPECGKVVLRKYLFTYGFCLIKPNIFEGNPENLRAIFHAFELGEPVIPDHYGNENPYFFLPGINKISAIEFSTHSHQGFTSRLAQAVHVDGTLQKIGKIKTSIIACARPAIIGGESILFNSTAAFLTILNLKKNCALALLDDCALTRISIETGESYTGPVFAFVDDEIVTRFSMDNTCRWNVDNVPFLEEAKMTLEGMLFNQQFSITHKLKENEILILLNSKISHGRNEFVDSPGIQRLFYRALFECNPLSNF